MSWNLEIYKTDKKRPIEKHSDVSIEQHSRKRDIFGTVHQTFTANDTDGNLIEALVVSGGTLTFEEGGVCIAGLSARWPKDEHYLAYGEKDKEGVFRFSYDYSKPRPRHTWLLIPNLEPAEQ